MKKSLLYILGLFLYASIGIWFCFKWCYWSNAGWCADWTPIIMIVLGLIIGLTGSFYFMFFATRKNLFGFKKILFTALPAILLISLSIYFKISEGARKNLIEACKSGNTIKAKTLLNLNADPNSTGTLHQASALYYAVTSENIEIVKALLDAGADPNMIPTNNIYNPLADAVRYECDDIKQLLINHGQIPRVCMPFL